MNEHLLLWAYALFHSTRQPRRRLHWYEPLINQNNDGLLKQFQLLPPPPNQHVKKIQAALSDPSTSLIPYPSDHYPAQLRHIDDPPLALFVRGSVSALSQQQLAVVGSRHPTRLGRQQTNWFCQRLSRAGLILTSGLARGIDGECHRTAVSLNHPTVAVVACGLDNTYPAAHKTLASQIIETGGTIVSEHCPGTPPLAHHFPARNRIISGLARATLVIEAASRSGTCITARCATDQGRGVFVVPGDPNCRNKQGCHELIRDGASLVSSPEDVLCELNGTDKNTPLSANARALLAALSPNPTPFDEIIQQTGLTPSKLSSMLCELQSHAQIQRTTRGYSKCPI